MARSVSLSLLAPSAVVGRSSGHNGAQEGAGACVHLSAAAKREREKKRNGEDRLAERT